MNKEKQQFESELMQKDLGDAAEDLKEESTILVDTDKTCDLKKKLYEENVKDRMQELTGFAETPKVSKPHRRLTLVRRFRLIDIVTSSSQG